MGVKVREKPKGSGVYWVFINHNGVRKSKKVGKNKKTAAMLAKSLEAKMTLKDFDMEAFNKKVPTLKQYGKEWFQLPHKLDPTSLHLYKRKMELYIYPVLGNRPLNEIKRRDLKAIFDGLLKDGMKEISFQVIKNPLSKIFRRALDSELIEVNPLAGLTHSRKRSIDIKPLTEEEAFTFLNAAKEYQNGKFYPHCLTLIRTGVRSGEFLSLKWSDIDFDKRQIHVQRHTVHGVMKKNTKNGKTRIVDMTPHLSDTLKELQKEKRKFALKNGTPFSEFCFTMGKRTQHMSVPKLRVSIKAIVEKAGLPKMRVHDLRHSYATIRLSKGHNIGDVSYQMGHSSIKITFDTYTHWIPGKFHSEVDDLDMHPNAPYPHPERIGNFE